jgi:hypothetical protein
MALWNKKTAITMLVSYGGDFVAGKKYKVDPDHADELILKGYAEGELSRRYTESEANSVTSTNQVVNF